MGRGALSEAEALVAEAWTCSGADTGTADVHAVVPAHIGRAALHLARLEFDAGIAVAEAALLIVDRTGYRAWAVHRLLPILAESYLHKHDFAAARRVEDRLRAEGTVLENPLALAWADTSAAILTWIQGEPERAAEIMRGCVEGLERVPFVPDAARLRRQLAGRLAQTGKRDEALRELRIAYDVFQRLDYRPELEKARGMFRELDARPPARVTSSRWIPLTGREQDIARRVADGRSNKAIARELGLSVRTVSTHMSNIFRKLDLDSRDQLTEYVRKAPAGSDG
jgi:DNA-binding CsgD family transcriptional regulator